MASFKLSALLCLASIAMPGQALAQSNGITSRQTNAGRLGADGFTRAVSKAGDLQTDMPCKYSEMGIVDTKPRRPDEHAAVRGTFMVCTDFQAQPFVMVIRSQYSTGAAGADHFFANMMNEDRRKGEVQEVEFSGYRAFRSLVIDDGACKWTLAVRNGAELSSVGVLIIGDDCKSREAEALRSMNSLVLK